MNDEPFLIKATEAAKKLAISERSLWTLTNRREIPSVRIGRSVRYTPDDLRDWIAKNRTETHG